jgi:hypothetical protein
MLYFRCQCCGGRLIIPEALEGQQLTCPNSGATVLAQGCKPFSEPHWLAWLDPQDLLSYLRGTASERKLRLFAVACCWDIRHLLQDDRLREAIRVGEIYADGLASARELNDAFSASEKAIPRVYDGSKYFYAACAARGVVEPNPWREGWNAHHVARCAKQAFPVQPGRQLRLLRDVFGNPFRPATIDPVWLAWNGGMIQQLARATYEERRFQDLPILADALEEAGCASHDLLAHFRGLGPHVRGCWALDALLAKE